MKSIKHLLVMLITALAFSVGYAEPPTTKVTGNVNLQKNVNFSKQNPSIQAVYTSQLGVREATGKNDGVQVEKYLNSVNLGKGNPWCAAFVKWTYLQAGYNVPITGWSPTAFNSKHVIYNGRSLLKPPTSGDVFVLWFPKLKRIAHTGFYDYGINKALYSSVEGNTNQAGSREGDGVYRKYRSYRATYRISRWI